MIQQSLEKLIIQQRFSSGGLRNMHRHKIALVAHDNLKPTLIQWSKANYPILAECALFATGTTGRLLAEQTGLEVTCLLSGPLGGDQQIGARISEGLIDILIFFWDPMTPVPHDADVKALLRIATLLNIPMANNQSTADCVLAMLRLSKTDTQPWVVNFNAPPLVNYTGKAKQFPNRSSSLPLAARNKYQIPPIMSVNAAPQPNVY